MVRPYRLYVKRIIVKARAYNRISDRDYERAYAFIVGAIRDRMPPTVTEVERAIGKSRGVAQRIIDKLVADGRLERVPGPRGLRLVDDETATPVAMAEASTKRSPLADFTESLVEVTDAQGFTEVRIGHAITGAFVRFPSRLVAGQYAKRVAREIADVVKLVARRAAVAALRRGDEQIARDILIEWGLWDERDQAFDSRAGADEFLYDLARCQRALGRQATVLELAAEIGQTPATVRERLDYLRATGQYEGYVTDDSLKPSSGPANFVLLAGEIAAGEPIEAIEHDQQWIPIDPAWLGHHHGYALRVRGDSMIGEGITDGSIVIVQRDAEYTPGGTFVCVDPETNSATLKRVFRQKGGWRLEPANPNLKPVHWSKIDLKGRVVKRIVDM